MLGQTMNRIKRNIKVCLNEMDEVIDNCEDLLWNNNIVILVDSLLYHQLEKSYRKLTIVRTCLYKLYANIEHNYTAFILDLTIEGHDIIQEITTYIKQIEAKWEEGDINITKYLLAQAALHLYGDNEELILDIDDLEYVANHPTVYWLCPYTVVEGTRQICHYSGWKTKQEAYLFAIQMSGCGRQNIFNRFNIQD